MLLIFIYNVQGWKHGIYIYFWVVKTRANGNEKVYFSKIINLTSKSGNIFTKIMIQSAEVTTNKAQLYS